MKTGRKLVAFVFIASLLSTSSCGYFLYPERVGQTEGKVDSTVVILDALGLFVGVIPGVVAFVVDFTTGAIYLPPGEETAIEKHRDRTSFIEGLPLQPVNTADMPVDREQLARQLSEQLGITVDPGAMEFYRVDQNTQIAMKQP